MITQYWKTEVLNNLFRSGDTAYVGLSVTTPTEDGNNVTEPTHYSYQRTELVLNEDNFSEPIDGTITNTTAITFKEAEDNWSTSVTPITNWTLHDSPVGGTLLAYGLITPSKVIDGSDVFSIPAGRMVIKVKNES